VVKIASSFYNKNWKTGRDGGKTDAEKHRAILRDNLFQRAQVPKNTTKKTQEWVCENTCQVLPDTAKVWTCTLRTISGMS